jgi:hypothetical protein
MLVTNAINVASNPVLTQEKEESEKPDMKEAIEEIEEKPRTNRWVHSHKLCLGFAQVMPKELCIMHSN